MKEECDSLTERKSLLLYQCFIMVKNCAKSVGTKNTDVATDIAENITVQERNKKSEKTKESVKEPINETFYDVMRLLDSDEEYIIQFVPEYKVLEDQVARAQADIESQERILRTFYAWRKNSKRFILKIMHRAFRMTIYMI